MEFSAFEWAVLKACEELKKECFGFALAEHIGIGEGQERTSGNRKACAMVANRIANKLVKDGYVERVCIEEHYFRLTDKGKAVLGVQNEN